MVIYVEEAHNLIGKKDDLSSTWPRIAKEGAKARIAFFCLDDKKKCPRPSGSKHS